MILTLYKYDDAYILENIVKFVHHTTTIDRWVQIDPTSCKL